MLLLSEVALGRTLDTRHADHSLTGATLGAADTTWGLGKATVSRYAPLPDGVRVPLGPLVPAQDVDESDLRYDEFVVYDVARTRMRFLVLLDFDFK